MARVATALGSAVTAGITALTVACADGPTAPTARPSFATTATRTTATPSGTAVRALVWTKPVAQTSSSRVIGPAGGSVSIADGIRVIVPKGAVTTNVTFSVTRLPGIVVAYDFQPHGTKFAVPVQIEQPTLGTNLRGLDPSAAIEGGYFADDAALDQSTGSAVVTEFRPTFVSADKAWVKFTVDHFSGYLVSSGRSQ
jgi:hypothetical protein